MTQIHVLNLLPLTGMETIFRSCNIILSSAGFKSLTPHGDGNGAGLELFAIANNIVLNLLPLTGMETLRRCIVKRHQQLVLNLLPLTGMETHLLMLTVES